MHFLAKRNVLLDDLNIVQKSIPLRSTLSITEGIFLQAKAKKLTMISNNLEMCIKSVNDDLEIFQEGAVVLPNKFIDILKQSPDDMVEVKMNDEFRTEITCGKANFFLYGMDPEEFPVYSDNSFEDDWEKIEFSALELKGILSKVIFAVSQDEGKPVFKGVLIEIDKDDNLIFIASDTYRLAQFKKNFKGEKKYQPLSILVPGKTLNEILKIIDHSQEIFEMYFRQNEIIFKYKHFFIYSRLLENKFPNLLSVFPPDFNTRIKVNTLLLEKTISRASLLSQGHNQMISLRIIDSKLQVKAASEVGRMSEELSLESKEGDNLEEILLNARFFLEPLRHLDEKIVEIDFKGPFGPCIFNYRKEKEDSIDYYRCLVLPIKSDKRDANAVN